MVTIERRKFVGRDTIDARGGLLNRGMPVMSPAGMIFKGTVIHVDSGHANASDSNEGTNPTRPMATIDAAVAKCAANNGDVILVSEGHAETIAAANAIDFDVAGITIIGLGTGEARPTITAATATGTTVRVQSANVRIVNLLFKCNIDSQTIVLDINAKDCLVENCEFREGAAKQYLTAIDIQGAAANACDRATIRNCWFSSIAAGADRAIELREIADEVTIAGCVIDGDWSDAGIHNPTGFVLTNLRLVGNIVRNRQTGDHAIELVSACTGEALGNALFADTPGVVFDPGSLFCADNWEAHAIDSGAVPSPAGNSGPDQWLHVAKATATLPATTTQTIFTVAGGRVLVKLLLGEVTTIIQAQATNLKVTSAPTTGTAVDLASNLDINAKEAGTLLLVEGDGTALVGANAGAALSGVGMMAMVIPVGVIRIETGATSTGATKWDIWYIPLDAGARVS